MTVDQGVGSGCNKDVRPAEKMLFALSGPVPPGSSFGKKKCFQFGQVENPFSCRLRFALFGNFAIEL
jgi:hypothetical protein